MTTAELSSIFSTQFGHEPGIFRSPGRVNLIGEHTDYNEGFVFPAAINKYVHIAIARNLTSTINLFAADLNKEISLSIDDLKPTNQWSDYILGVVDELKKIGKTPEGFDCVLSSDIPIGAGMSSSAAIECATAFALNDIFNLNLTSMEMVQLSQKAENLFVGMQCGIMDQFASMMGKPNQAMVLDCRSLEYQYVPFNYPDHELLLVNSMVKHELTDSGYNTRREECEKAIGILREMGNNVSSLREVDFEMLESYSRYMDPLLVQRARYVIEENKRVLQYKTALTQGEIEFAGELMYASHHGLSRQYEVSCPELDFLVELTLQIDGIEGSRMMGGGFGGCTINLIRKDSTREAIRFISDAYLNQYEIEPEFYIAEPAQGTAKI